MTLRYFTCMVIPGLARVRTEATFRRAQTATSTTALENAVRTDVFRAADLATPTLRAFDTLSVEQDDAER
jgi:hypothetical protein